MSDDFTAAFFAAMMRKPDKVIGVEEASKTYAEGRRKRAERRIKLREWAVRECLERILHRAEIGAPFIVIDAFLALEPPSALQFHKTNLSRLIDMRDLAEVLEQKGFTVRILLWGFGGLRVSGWDAGGAS